MCNFVHLLTNERFETLEFLTLVLLDAWRFDFVVFPPYSRSKIILIYLRVHNRNVFRVPFPLPKIAPGNLGMSSDSRPRESATECKEYMKRK